MEKNERQNWEKDFQEFAATENASVPTALTDDVQGLVSAALHPSGLKVFGKLSLITFVVGTLTLLFCPQFGISLTSSMGLMHYLMPFGDAVCMLGCGGLFTGISLFVASLLLLPEEILQLKKNMALQLSSLSIISLGAFICAGGQVVLTLGLIWIFGAIAGGMLTLEAGWRWRLRKTVMVRI
jgi:hypothetical protein